MYILWRTTGNPIWRDRGWEMFDAIEKRTRVANGYANIAHVNVEPLLHLDEMPRFAFAYPQSGYLTD